MNASRTSYTAQRARFELLGGVGAAVLGAGVGLVFRTVLTPLAVPLLLMGLVLHGGVCGASTASMPRPP
jgi:hypothetical protein